jgi:hypothetical protein
MMLNLPGLIDKCLAELAGLGVEEESLPEPFAQAKRMESQGELLLRNRFFRLPGLGELRSASIVSPKINIANLFFFPEPRQQLPVYANEFVVLGSKPIVAVIDAKCLLPSCCSEQVETILQNMHFQNPQFRQDVGTPNWYNEERSGRDFFIRPGSLEEMAEIIQLNEFIWREIVSLFVQPTAYVDTISDLHAKRLRAYKDNHRLHSPGIPMLIRCFGEDWTSAYLADYFFK